MEEAAKQTNAKLKSLQRVVISVNWLIILFFGMGTGIILYNKNSFAKLNGGPLSSKVFTTTIVILLFTLFLLILGFCIPVYSKKRVYSDSVLWKIPERMLTALRVFSEVVLFFLILSPLFHQNKALLTTEVFAVLFLFSLQILMFSKRFKYVLLLFIAAAFSALALMSAKLLFSPNAQVFSFWILSFVLVELVDAVSCIVIKENT